MFGNYGVLTERELESRYEVYLEQYVTKLNIEAETAASIARTMILPAAVRHLNELKRTDLDTLVREVQPIVETLVGSIQTLEKANRDHPDDGDLLAHATYMRDTVIPAMEDVRVIADGLERLVADDLWPLPKYEEMLFIK
jgi:glutamine synthetase